MLELTRPQFHTLQLLSCLGHGLKLCVYVLDRVIGRKEERGKGRGGGERHSEGE